jgi:transposase
MRPHSLDLRQRIVDAYDGGEGSIRELAERFAVNPSTVQRYLRRRQEAGSVEPRPPGGGHPRSLDARAERALWALLREKNDLPDREYARRLAERLGRPVSRQAVNRTWKRLGVTRKNKTLRASEQSRPDVQRSRQRFARSVRQFPGRRRVYVDEFGTNLGLTPRFARAPRGRRALGSAPVNKGANVTLVMGLGVRGIVAPFAFRGAMNEAVFEGYVCGQLAPALRPGDVVLVDRLPAHFAPEARRCLEAVGAHLRFLPPYSPDLNPVEEAGGNIKAVIRADEPRTVPALYDAMGRGIGAVTPSHVRGWFLHRGHVRIEEAVA